MTFPSCQRSETLKEHGFVAALKGRGFVAALKGHGFVETLKGRGFVETLKRHGSVEALKGHGFSRAAGCPQETGALAPEGRFCHSIPSKSVLTGHDLGRAAKCPYETRALAPPATPKGTSFSPYIHPPKNTRTLAPEGIQISKTILTLTCLALLAPLSLPAQQSKPWDKIPIPKLHEFKPQQPKRIELKNGIVIFLQEDHELPFVSGSVLIPGGSRDEDPAKTGLVGLYGQAWRTSGTAKMDGDALDDLLEAKAAHIETAGDEDSTALSWDSLKGDADQVFSLALDLLLHPKFDKEKLELAQQQEATGIVRRNDDEGSIAEREAAKLVYGADSPYTRQPELATIGAVTVADLKAWHDKTINNKLIIGVAGDFDSAAMEAKLRAAFEPLPPVKALPPRHDTFPGPTPGVYFIQKDDVNQSDVIIAGMGIDRHNPDVPSVAIMNEILGGGFASRLFQKVRTELGLAYEVNGGISFGYDHPGPFTAIALTKSPTTVEATQAVMKEIAGMNTRPFTQEELDRAKDNILNSFLFRYDTKDKVLAERERLEFYGYPADYLETYKAALEKVTVSDLTEVAKKYIHPDKLAILVVGNGPEIKPGLDTLNLGPIHPIDITIPMPKQPQGAEKQ